MGPLSALSRPTRSRALMGAATIGLGSRPKPPNRAGEALWLGPVWRVEVVAALEHLDGVVGKQVGHSAGTERRASQAPSPARIR